MEIETMIADDVKANHPSKEPNYKARRKWVGIGCIALAFIVLSPTIEWSRDVTVGEAAITQTCYDRHGFNFISRWSCRSALQRVGFVGLGLSCGFSKGPNDFCDNLNKISADNDQTRARINHVDGRTP
jgi:hypothetical protein